MRATTLQPHHSATCHMNHVKPRPARETVQERATPHPAYLVLKLPRCMHCCTKRVCLYAVQVEEAVGCYHRLQVATSLEGGENKLGLPGPRRAAIAQLGAALKLRVQVWFPSSAWLG